MLSKRYLFAKTLDKCGFLSLLLQRNKKADHSSLTILAYHRVVSFDQKETFNFDENLISATPEGFESQIKWLKKYFNIISFGALRRGKAGSNSLILTFDDGYKDNYEIVYPILKKHNVPATIFLSTGYIGTDKLFWWDEISYLIKKSVKDKVSIGSGKLIEYALVTKKNKNDAIFSLLKVAKTVKDADRNKIIKQLQKKLDTGLEDRITPSLALNWDEIREMSRGGIEFGAHSVNHPILSNVTDETLKYEIEESKKVIEKQTGKTVTVFSYPVGGDNSFNDKVRHYLQQAGYQYVVTYIHGTNRTSNLERYTLKRIHVEKEDNMSIFKTKMLFPSVMRY